MCIEFFLDQDNRDSISDLKTNKENHYNTSELKKEYCKRGNIVKKISLTGHIKNMSHLHIKKKKYEYAKVFNC